MKKTTKFLLTIEKSDIDKLKELAESKGLSTSAYIRMILKEHIN